jgi:hypothetical protein
VAIAHTYLDNVEVTDVVKQGSSTHLLNAKWTATCQIPIDRAVDAIGKRMRVEIDGFADIDFHGLVKHVSAESGEDAAEVVEYSAEDPRELWQWRPARDGPDASAPSQPGNYSNPLFFQQFKCGCQIMEQILIQSDNFRDPLQPPYGNNPKYADGDLFLDFGGFSLCGTDISGAPTNFPMTIEEVAALIIGTGTTDIILKPINYGGNMAQVNCWNGDAGTDLYDTVHLSYDNGGNVRQVRMTNDMDSTVNKLRYLLGKRYDDEHWRRSIELTNTDFPGWPASPPFSTVNAAVTASRAAGWGIRSEIRTYDTYGTEANLTKLYQWEWLAESLIRAGPRTLVHVTPVRGLLPGVNFPTFDVGDLIRVSAWNKFRGGFDGKQRVYGRTLNWDENGTFDLGEILTSSDAAGF